MNAKDGNLIEIDLALPEIGIKGLRFKRNESQSLF
ncbi:MAG: hypothetical protein Pg6A_12610 [Termitinemataceae bacterium]|nr:MAG: hypothetical protein Pg6A_12610 [Termitinemataceae bacterium]